MTAAPSIPSQVINRRILIVDDLPEIQNDFSRILTPKPDSRASLDALKVQMFGDVLSARASVSFELDFASQGEQAAALAGQARMEGRPYALAFVDTRMPPGWDGIETIEHLWRVDPFLQVVICSAYSDYSWNDISACFPATDSLLVLKKPFEPIEVLQLASALTRKWTLEQQDRLSRAHLEAMVAERSSEIERMRNQLETEHEERERMEVELRLAQKLEAVGQLAAGIAHEINTPMQYIGDSVQFLRQAFEELLAAFEKANQCTEALSIAGGHDKLVDEAREAADIADHEYLREQGPRAIERTLEGVERVSSTVRAMRDFAHPDQKEKSPSDLNRALQSAVIVSRNEYKYVADIETEFDEIPPIPCHPGEINQVFLNLIVNAAHAIEEKIRGTNARGTIRIHTARKDGHVRITIADNGNGIPREIQNRIFDPFFTTKAAGKGTGQGLAISRSIVVDKHGGRIHFSTTPGEGTAFYIELPIEVPSDEGEVAA